MPNTLFHLQFPAPEEPPQIKLDSFFESLDGWDIFVSGSGTTTQDADKIVLTTGATLNSVSSLVERYAYPPGVMTWAKKRTFKLKARLDVFSDAASEIYLCSGHEAANRWGFGFRFTNTMVRGFSKNGGAEQYVNLVTGLVAPYTRDELYEAVFTPGANVKFYINDVLLGTLAAGLPTGTTDAERLFRMLVYSSVAVNHQIRTSYVKAIQEL